MKVLGWLFFVLGFIGAGFGNIISVGYFIYLIVTMVENTTFLSILWEVAKLWLFMVPGGFICFTFWFVIQYMNASSVDKNNPFGRRQ